MLDIWLATVTRNRSSPLLPLHPPTDGEGREEASSHCGYDSKAVEASWNYSTLLGTLCGLQLQW